MVPGPGKFMAKDLQSRRVVLLLIRKIRSPRTIFRFTAKGDTLFVTALGLPANQLSIKMLSLKSGNGKITGINMLGSSQKIRWKQTADELLIKPSVNYPSEYAVSYAVTFAH